MVHLAVFLLTFSGLIFEIALTRIYSATIWYHFAFVAVSVALLGWGLGGFMLHLARRRVTASMDLAAVVTLAYAISIPVCLAILGQFPFRMDRLALYFLAPLVPFLLAGMALSMIFSLRRDTATSLYFADLAGASLGAAAVTFFLQAVGGETTLLIAAVAPAVAAAVLSTRARSVAAIGAVLLAVTALANGRAGFLRVTPGELKALPRHMNETPGTRVTQTGWNAYSRIDAVEGFAPRYLARLYIDSDAWTNTLRWDGRVESLDVRDTYRALSFSFTPNAHTLVIGPGGGADAIMALGAGSRKVTVVELNPLMLEFVRHYGPAAGNVYNRPDVEVIQSEGRNFISRTERKFDVIFMGFVDTWASVASGGLSLSENYLYTTRGDPGVLRSSDRRWRAGDHEMGHGYPASRDEHGVVPRRERSGEADRRCPREARHARRSGADDLPVAQASLQDHGGYGGYGEMEPPGQTRARAWSARGSAIRRSLRRPEIARGRHRRA